MQPLEACTAAAVVRLSMLITFDHYTLHTIMTGCAAFRPKFTVLLELLLKLPLQCLPHGVQSMEALTAEVDEMRRRPSPLAAAQAAKQEVLVDQRKFQEVIAGNQVTAMRLLHLPELVRSTAALPASSIQQAATVPPDIVRRDCVQPCPCSCLCTPQSCSCTTHVVHC